MPKWLCSQRNRVFGRYGNENTTNSFTDPVTVEGQTFPKGTYGLRMLPTESEWTVIFSRVHTAWGSYIYDPAQDGLRVKVKPQPAEMHQLLTYDFDEVTPEHHARRRVGNHEVLTAVDRNRRVCERARHARRRQDGELLPDCRREVVDLGRRQCAAQAGRPRNFQLAERARCFPIETFIVPALSTCSMNKHSWRARCRWV